MIGVLLWVPLIWNSGIYPVLTHRYLMLNGFVASFVCGFLMTALPKFSKTQTATMLEVGSFLVVTFTGLIFAYADKEELVFLFSSFQPLIILVFMFTRVFHRQANPPYSFIFIFVGLFLWFASGIGSIFFDAEFFKQLHYEGAIASIILGVGSRLIPGILGHVEIVQAQREQYEKPVPLLSTVPIYFFLMIISFVASYLLSQTTGAGIRALVVAFVAFKFWRLWKAPEEKTALTWSIWTSAWLIVLSFFLKAFSEEGLIHMSHSFFICGIVLLSLLVATRVLQSHGPKDKGLENLKLLYVVTFLIALAAATRVSAYLIPELYLSHLAYSSIILVIAVGVWSFRYLRYVGRSHF